MPSKNSHPLPGNTVASFQACAFITSTHLVALKFFKHGTFVLLFLDTILLFCSKTNLFFHSHNRITNPPPEFALFPFSSSCGCANKCPDEGSRWAHMISAQFLAWKGTATHFLNVREWASRPCGIARHLLPAILSFAFCCCHSDTCGWETNILNRAIIWRFAYFLLL